MLPKRPSKGKCFLLKVWKDRGHTQCVAVQRRTLKSEHHFEIGATQFLKFEAMFDLRCLCSFVSFCGPSMFCFFLCPRSFHFCSVLPSPYHFVSLFFFSSIPPDLQSHLTSPFRSFLLLSLFLIFLSRAPDGSMTVLPRREQVLHNTGRQ